MKTMATHGSATVCEQAPHATQTTRTKTILNALTRRAQAVLNDKSIDAESRAIIRYGLEVNDPWLADLVWRAESGERIGDRFDFSQTHEDNQINSTFKTDEYDSSQEKIEALADIICRRGENAATAFLVLMGTLENSANPRALARMAKSAIERELWAKETH
jgi:hypothetical protein